MTGTGSRHARCQPPDVSRAIPVLIVHGTDDKAIVCHGSEFFHETVGSKDKTLKLYQGHHHDLLADIGKEG